MFMQTFRHINLIKTLMIWALCFNAHALPLKNIGSTKITGGDELYSADVVFEDGINKLQVKATIVPQLGQLFQEHAENAGSKSLAVNGATTPVMFNVLADPTKDKFIDVCLIYFLDNGIKVQNFLGLNSPLTNGVTISIQSEGTIVALLPILKTVDINNHFATEAMQLIFSAGGDYAAGRFKPSTPFVLKAGSSDYVRVTINDNLSSVSEGEFVCNGTFD